VLLADEEVRDYRVYLTDVKSYKAATVNSYLTPIRAIVRAQGRTLKVKGTKCRPWWWGQANARRSSPARHLGRLILQPQATAR